MLKHMFRIFLFVIKMLLFTQDFIRNSAANFTAYLTYHSYGQYLLYPWGYDNAVPPDHKDLNEVGNRMAAVSDKLKFVSPNFKYSYKIIDIQKLRKTLF